jgi:hypothetical protein
MEYDEKSVLNRQDRKAMPMVFHHCVELFKVLTVQAEEVEGRQIWTGYMTHIIKDELNLSVPYYTSILNAMKRMGCIEQLQRGGSSTPSKWLLLAEPTEEVYNSPAVRRSAKNPGRLDQLEGMLFDLNTRLERLETLIASGIEM